MRRTLILLSLLLGICSVVKAQEDYTKGRRILSNGTDFFVPHWFATIQGGAAYDVGEAKFTNLISPALQLSVGYQYNHFLSTRLAVSGWQARNQYSYPLARYSWNFIQPSLDAMLNLTSLIGGWKPERFANVYAFAGLGVAYSFNNDDAEEADKRFGIDFQKLWHGHRWNPVVRAGVGADFRISDNIALGAEVNANMLPDHFNSKLGKKDNRDWHFNALVGIKFTIGKDHGRTEQIYEELQPQLVTVPDTVFIDVPIEKISFNVNIYFLINQSTIRSSQIPKLTSLLRFLREHPRAFIRLSGYADKETGTPEINMRLSRERAQVVSQYLQDEGIQEWRIRRFAKGDKVQPFDIPADNRVCICFVYDPDNPVPQPFEY